MDFDVVIEDEISEYERLRERNMKEIEAMMAEFADDVADSISVLNSFKKQPSSASKKKRYSKNKDSSFVCSAIFPLERRRSERLLHVTPRYSYEDLVDEEDMKRDNRSYSDDLNDLEKVIFRRKKSLPKRSIPSYVPAGKVTSAYLENIATRTTKKTYCQKNGTSCHQCRQKTLDSKTYCRSGQCVGVRGQFCGVCLKNRYGEDAKEALLNPRWKCPPCRGLCNCSICRTREGKRPTGILAPLAFQYGHKSVKDFLISLRGEGDYAGKDDGKSDNGNKYCRKYNDNINELLIGFNPDLKPIWFVKEKPLVFGDNDDALLGFTLDKEPVMTKI